MIRAIRQRISLSTRDESGFGLAEFVVAIGLFSVLATIIVLTFSSFTTTLTRDRAATTNTNLATLGMDEMTRMIRSATSIPQISGVDLPAFVYANKEKVVFYAYIDTESTSPEPVKVQFEVATAASGNIQIRDLVETRWAAHPKAGAPNYWEFDAANDPQSVRVVARKIVNRAAGEAYLFNYQEIGADLLPDDMTIPVSGIAAANLPKIAVVEVTIKVQSDATGRAAPVTMTNQVGIPNLGISRLGLS